jgi:hypothetical protein
VIFESSAHTHPNVLLVCLFFTLLLKELAEFPTGIFVEFLYLMVERAESDSTNVVVMFEITPIDKMYFGIYIEIK